MSPSFHAAVPDDRYVNYSTIVDRWAVVGNAVTWILGDDIVLDETPLDDLPDDVRAVVLSGDRERPNFFLELFGVITPNLP